MKRSTIMVSILGIVVTLVLVLGRLEEFTPEVLPLLLLLVSPYLIMLAMAFYLGEGGGSRFFTLSSWILLAMAGAFYLDAFILHPDPQSGLVFVVVTTYQWGLLLPVLAIAYYLHRKEKSRVQ